MDDISPDISIRGQEMLQKCDQKMSILPDTFHYYILAYAWPLIILVGIMGNCINLAVLLKIKSKCHWFLTCMAAADILFFVCMFPKSLSAYSVVFVQNWFRLFHFFLTPTLLVFTNWFSSSSCW